MGIKQLIGLIILGMLCFTSCNNNDDDTIENDTTVTLNGTWNLKNVYGGLLGVDIDYKEGEVVWIFNLEQKTLLVKNNIMTTGPENSYYGLNSGTYNFEIKETDDIQTLLINDQDRGKINVLETNLILDDNLAADGFVKTFER